MEKLKIGTIVRGFGIKGEVKIKLHTDQPEKRFKSKRKLIVEVNGERTILTVVSTRFHQGHALVMFDGYNDLSSVEPLVGAELFIELSEKDLAKEKGYYPFQLINLTVVDNDGQKIGVVSEVMPTYANDVLRIKTEDKDILVPFVPAFIQGVDLTTKTITVVLLEGMR